jgi:hypothetical protein
MFNMNCMFLDEKSLEGSLEKLESSLGSILDEQSYIKQKEQIARRSLAV